VAAGISPFLAKPELTGRAVVYAVASGVLGALILGGIAYAAGQGGVARTISLVIATQLLVGLVLDSIGLFGPTRGAFSPLDDPGRAPDPDRWRPRGPVLGWDTFR
jgi:uncharacterized membrane protein YdcZ (DUF606 family)